MATTPLAVLDLVPISSGSSAIEALRKQALVECDANGNGKLEKTEIH